ncbi:MAG: hypothetical protein K8R91_05130 [Phycisphaerae bacterium]|nr:hypothetical protein [Phycisphaerae bacterium]
MPSEPEDHGIGRMMDIFDRHGAKGVFFVNVYEAPKSGNDTMAEVCRAINSRGHDLELHTHPKPMFGVGYMQYADLTRQTEILKRGAELIEEWAGVKGVAHRAGGYMANLDTIKACKETEIPLEFSYNMGWPQSDLGREGLAENAPFVRDGVLCIPVTCYIQASAGGWRSMRFLDIEASSPQEIRKVVADLHAHGVRTAVIMMHSFSFSRSGKPNERVERALAELVAGFVADPNVEVVTARQLYEIWRADPDALLGADYIPTTGWRMTYHRAWQRLGEGWKNVAVAFAPPVFLVLVIGGGGFWLRRHRRKRKAAARGNK